MQHDYDLLLILKNRVSDHLTFHLDFNITFLLSEQGAA